MTLSTLRSTPKVKSLSPNHRIVIALYSPGGVVPMCPPEKWRESLSAGFSGTVSPVRFDGKTCGIAAISRDFRSNAAEILCIPDCVAEREGFYYRRYLQVPLKPTLPA